MGGRDIDSVAVGRALDACYAAVLDPETWPDALHGLARSLGSVCTLFYPRDAAHTLLRVPASPDFRDFLEEFVRDGWWANDHRALRGWPRFAGGRKVVLDHDVASDDERRNMPVYNELYNRYDMPGWAAVSFLVEGRLWAVPFLRSGSQGAWTREEAERLRSLAPHFERILDLASKLAAGAAKTALDLLDRIDCPAMLIDWRGSVIRKNALAEALIGRGLELRNGRLSAQDRNCDAALQTLISQAVAGCAPSSLRHTDPVVINRLGHRALLVDAVPATDLLADTFLYTRAILLVTDLDRAKRPPESRIRLALGLTASEARLASLIGSGLPPQEAAERLGISKENARTSLKRVFAKAGVSRQSELATLLAKLLLR